MKPPNCSRHDTAVVQYLCDVLSARIVCHFVSKALGEGWTGLKERGRGVMGGEERRMKRWRGR